MFNDVWLRLRSLFRRKAVESEMDEELRFHFEKQVEKFVRSGVAPDGGPAPRAAGIRRNGASQGRIPRGSRGVNFLETLLQDIRYGLRILGRTPVITSVAILSLALGIGANTAIFSLIDTVMLRMLAGAKTGGIGPVAPAEPEAGRRAYFLIDLCALGAASRPSGHLLRGFRVERIPV